LDDGTKAPNPKRESDPNRNESRQTLTSGEKKIRYKEKHSTPRESDCDEEEEPAGHEKDNGTFAENGVNSKGAPRINHKRKERK
jgi:hypothetical protein